MPFTRGRRVSDPPLLAQRKFQRAGVFRIVVDGDVSRARVLRGFIGNGTAAVVFLKSAVIS